jgi:glycosyltransferase involved in cell wall biosynthesis
MARESERIGLLYPDRDPISAANWSGTPRGLHAGLTAHGFEVVPIGCDVGLPVRPVAALLSRSRGRRGVEAHRAPAYVLARSRALAREFSKAQPLRALLAMDTDSYDLRRVLGRSSVPTATYDDGTFALFSRHPDSEVRRFGFRLSEVHTWAARQSVACRRADVCCVSTSWAAQSVIDDYGLPPSRVRVVGMGHRPRSTSGQTRDWSVPRFLFVGVDWGRKNGDAVLAAFAAVRQQFPKATLDLVGGHPPIDLPGVTGHGLLPREDPTAQRLLDLLFARSTVFVLPSRFDPSPIAYLEAASAGLPVIATTEGGAGELLGAAALTVHPDDRPGLEQAMLRLSDPEFAESLGAEASRRAAESSWEAVAGRILDSLGLVVEPA